jgi:hypothetical protein
MGSEDTVRGSTEMHAAVYDAIDQHVGQATGHRDVHIDGHPTCPCGQELDTCRRAHCPRCGHRLPVARSHVA